MVLFQFSGGKLLLEMNRILRPGGYFILSTKHDNIEEEEGLIPYAFKTFLFLPCCGANLSKKFGTFVCIITLVNEFIEVYFTFGTSNGGELVYLVS